MSTETSISLMLLGVSIIYFLIQPKKINYLYGYRTRNSKKSIEHWKIANKMASKGLLTISLFNTIISLILVDFLKVDFLNIFVGLLLLEFAILIYWVEKKLKQIDSNNK